MDSLNFFVYKKCCRDDILKKVFDIYTENFRKYIRIPKNVIKNRLKNDTYELNILKKNKNIIGFSFVAIFEKYKCVFIDYIAIAKKYHGRGYGKILFNRIFDHYVKEKNSHETLVLECENSLMNMYIKWGCRKIPILYRVNDLELNIMVKSNENWNTDMNPVVRDMLLDFNEDYLGRNSDIQKLNHVSNISNGSKFMKNINFMICSLLRDIYCTSRIWKKYVI